MVEVCWKLSWDRGTAVVYISPVMLIQLINQTRSSLTECFNCGGTLLLKVMHYNIEILFIKSTKLHYVLGTLCIINVCQMSSMSEYIFKIQ